MEHVVKMQIYVCCFVQVLQCIPDNWSLGLIHQFLMSSVRKTLNRSRTTRVERMLLRGDNLAMRLHMFLLTRAPFYMTEDRQVVFYVFVVVSIILQLADDCVAWWRSCRMPDLQSIGRRFESRPPHCRVKAWACS